MLNIKAGAYLLAFWLLLPALDASAGFKMIGSTVAINRNAVTGGGGLVEGAGLKLNAATGEAGVSSFTGAGLRLYAGLMHQIAQPGSVVAITTVTKSTGSLHLSWSAPGLDGFVGNVVNGFYRIDSSSDPTHVFAPTVFVTEFATSVVPGDAQSYVLTGLEPNATYYTRIYLSDERKMVAETSRQSEESTLANVPAAPVFSGIFESSVTISWTLPTKGAEGYRAEASSSNFGALFSGGTLSSSQTPNGLVVTLTVSNLTPYSTYYFKLASLNWQSDLNFSTVLSTRTLPGDPLPPYALVFTGDRLNRQVLVSWSLPVFRDPDGVLVQISTMPISADPIDGNSYPVGYAFADGSVVTSSTAAFTHLQTGLELDTTEYFRLHSKNSDRVYSLAVSTYLVMDLPPMAPAGLASTLAADGSSITMRWGGVASNLDGSGFRQAVGVNGWEINRYTISRSTGIARSNWVWLADLPITASSFTASVPEPGRVYYYRIEAKDNFGNETDDSMVMDSDLNLYAVAADQVTRLKIPAQQVAALQAAGNRWGKDLLIRAKDRPQDLGDRVVRSVSFDTYLAPSGLSAPLGITAPGMEVVLQYKTENGQVVPSAVLSDLERESLALSASGGLSPLAAAAPPLKPSVGANAAPTNLAAYWQNADEYVKLFGHVDLFNKTVALNTAMLGAYQIRSVLRSAGFSFDIAAISNKAITPNGDGLNDTVVFIFDNPMDSSFAGKIYDMRGAFVADMRTGPLLGQSLLWDGKAANQTVPGGVYVYQIKAENKVFNGTLMVIR